MTTHESDEIVHDVEVAWDSFEERLAAYLATMQHTEDRLLLELPDGAGPGTAPYAQVDVIRPAVLRAELSGNAVLEEIHQLDTQGLRAVCGLGWEAPDSGQGFPNYNTEVEVDDADVLAQMIRIGLGEEFGIADPGLLSYRAWGPAAEHVDVLGLASSDEITDVVSGTTVATMPRDREHLLELVGDCLAELFGEPLEQDDDDDFVIPTPHGAAYVRVRVDEPTIEVFTAVVRDIRSRRQTLVEIGILNRDAVWTKYVIRDRAVVGMLTLPARPFAAEQLSALLPMFLVGLDAVRDDLVLRTGGRA